MLICNLSIRKIYFRFQIAKHFSFAIQIDVSVRWAVDVAAKKSFKIFSKVSDTDVKNLSSSGLPVNSFLVSSIQDVWTVDVIQCALPEYLLFQTDMQGRLVCDAVMCWRYKVTILLSHLFCVCKLINDFYCITMITAHTHRHTHTNTHTDIWA